MSSLSLGQMIEQGHGGDECDGRIAAPQCRENVRRRAERATLTAISRRDGAFEKPARCTARMPAQGNAPVRSDSGAASATSRTA